MHDNACVCVRVPPYIGHHQSSAFCASVQVRKNFARKSRHTKMRSLRGASEKRSSGKCFKTKLSWEAQKAAARPTLFLDTQWSTWHIHNVVCSFYTSVCEARDPMSSCLLVTFSPNLNRTIFAPRFTAISRNVIFSKSVNSEMLGWNGFITSVLERVIRLSDDSLFISCLRVCSGSFVSVIKSLLFPNTNSSPDSRDSRVLRFSTLTLFGRILMRKCSFRAIINYTQRPCMRCVPPYISHYQNSAFCVSVQVPEKLSKELITFKDAEPARSQWS